MGPGLKIMAEDLGFAFEVNVFTDSSSANGTVSRRRLGKVRHVATCYLWAQERVANKELFVQKVRTDRNIADLMTERLERRAHEPDGD